MNNPYLPLNFNAQPMPASGPRNCSRSALRYGPLLLAIFAAASAFPATGAQASEPRITRLSAVVSYRDLDLVRPTDQQVLKHRTRDTARALCRKLNRGWNQRIWCAKDAVKDAAPQMRQAIAQAGAREMAAASPR